MEVQLTVDVAGTVECVHQMSSELGAQTLDLGST